MKGEAEKVKEIRIIVSQPFLAYPELSQRERRAATMASRGQDYKSIAKQMKCAPKSVYRYLDSAAEKISLQDGRRITKNKFVEHALKRIMEVLNE